MEYWQYKVVVCITEMNNKAFIYFYQKTLSCKFSVADAANFNIDGTLMLLPSALGKKFSFRLSSVLYDN